VVPTVLVDLYWLAGNRTGGGLQGIDVGTSAVVVTAAAALAVLTRSPPLGAALAAGLAVDLATTPDLASVEHLVAVAIGIAGALLLPLPDRRPRLPIAARSPYEGAGVSTRVRSDSTSS
jgi:hypothetical protein